MRILVDLVHPVDVNFYKKAIEILRKDGHEVIITVMDRGRLPQIVKHDIGAHHIVGGHAKGGFIPKALMNLKRVRLLRKFIRKVRPDVVTSFSYYPAAATYGTKIPSIVFHDDEEYRMQWRLCKFFSDRLIVPKFVKDKAANITKYNSFKEWAYLKDFKPNADELKKFGLKKKGYVFVREAASVSLNYQDGKHINLRPIIEKIRNLGLKAVILSESERSSKDDIMLKHPLDDVYSLIYYAKAMISSGDTMPREAALLGVPAYYTGLRDMAVNKPLIKAGLFFEIKDQKNLLKIDLDRDISKKAKGFTRLLDDVTALIVKAIENESITDNR